MSIAAGVPAPPSMLIHSKASPVCWRNEALLLWKMILPAACVQEELVPVTLILPESLLN